MQDLYRSKSLRVSGKVFFLPLIFLVLLSSFVFAQPTSQFSSNVVDVVAEIAFPKNQFFEFGEDFKVHFHVFNSTGYQLAANQVSCGFHLYGFTNNNLYEGKLVSDANGVDVFFNANSTYITGVGVYPYIVACNTTQGQYGFVSNSFEVTTDGFSSSGIGNWMIIFTLFIVGMIFYIAGRVFEDYTTGVVGGLLVFLLGVYILIFPVNGFADWINLLVGSVFFAWGAYTWVRGTIEGIQA